MTAAEQAVAQALWKNIEDDFAAEAAHRAFIEHCRQCGDLAFAAQRYQLRKRDGVTIRPDEAAAIEARLASITAIAMAQIEAHDSGPPVGEGLRRGIVIVAALLVLAAIAVFLKVLQL